MIEEFKISYVIFVIFESSYFGYVQIINFFFMEVNNYINVFKNMETFFPQKNILRKHRMYYE